VPVSADDGSHHRRHRHSGTEVGDDKGGRGEVEPGDDHGGDRVEVGDDHSGSGHDGSDDGSGHSGHGWHDD
jgi:hypothetical protein